MTTNFALEAPLGTSLEACRDALASRGCFLAPVQLPAQVREQVLRRDWAALDGLVGIETRPGGSIFEELSRHAPFSEIEFIISIRSSLEAPDEDGIWHDDGSRVLAFSLSLSLGHEAIRGGRLEIRRRGAKEGDPAVALPTPPYGTMIVFATGHQGFEHKINRVTEGERIIIAGWCT